MDARTKIAVIIPSWSGHIAELTAHLTSFARRVEDARTIPVHIIVSTAEIPAFQAALGPIANLSFRLHPFARLVFRQTGYLIDEDALLAACGPVTFQSLKKLYALLDLDYDCCLLTDSEARWIRPTNLRTEITSYMADPFVLTSTRTDNVVQEQARAITADLLGVPAERWLGLVFFYQWIFEKRVASALADHLLARGVTFPALSARPRFFVETLYYRFLEISQFAPKYRFLDVRDLLVRHHATGAHVFAECPMEHLWSWLAPGDHAPIRAIYQTTHSFAFMSQQIPPPVQRPSLQRFVQETPQIAFLASSPQTPLWLPHDP